MGRRTMVCGRILLCVAVTGAPILSQDPASVQSTTGVRSGLCVHVGTTDGQFEVGIAADGAFLVHGLCTTDDAVKAGRGAATGAGLHPLASFERIIKSDRLPFPDNTVNLLVADLDAMSTTAPSTGEIERVLVPGGVSYVKIGSWRSSTKAMPPEFDDWTHWCHGPDGNALSQDQVVAPSTSLKWMMGWRTPDLRIAGGKVVHSVGPQRPFPDKTQANGYLCARDAFNGLISWKQDFESPATNRSYWDKVCKYPFVATDEGVFLWLGRSSSPKWPDQVDHYAVKLSLDDGRVLTRYTEGLTNTDSAFFSNNAGKPFLVSSGTVLLQAFRRNVRALDADGGAVRWSWQSRNPIGYMVADERGDKVWVQETRDLGTGGGRWNTTMTTAVVCVDKGTEVWRVSDSTVTEGLSQLILTGNRLVLFNPVYGMDPAADQFDGRDMGGITCLDAATGRLLWKPDRIRLTYNMSWINGIARDTSFFTWGSFNNFKAYSLATGGEYGAINNGYNQRCPRMNATVNWCIYGLGTWVGRDLTSFIQQSVGRGECAMPAFPAYGQVFWNPNFACTCIRPLRGIVSACSQPVWAPIEENQRSLAGDNGASALPASMADQSATANSVVASEWQGDSVFQVVRGGVTGTATYQDLSIQGEVDRHWVTALRATAKVWRFTAAGRIYGTPLVDGSRCFVASADGWVYSLHAATGAVNWRFLAAAAERKVVVNGQLESAWPVNGLTMHQGALCFSAGRHSELDGGIFLYGLDPATGAVRWRTTLYLPQVLVAGKPPKGSPDFSRDGASATPINGYLVSDSAGLRLVVPQWHKHGSSGSANGYFLDEAGQYTESSTGSFAIDPVAWNGLTINPRTSSAVAVLDGRDLGDVGRAPAGPSAISLGLGWFRLDAAANATLIVLDARGRTVRTLYKGAAQAGVTSFNPGIQTLPAGFHVLALKAGGMSRRLEVVKP